MSHDPYLFARVFEGTKDGEAVFQELVTRFYRNPYKAGGPEAARATDFNAGSFEVVQYICNRCDQARGAPAPDEEQDAAPR